MTGYLYFGVFLLKRPVHLLRKTTVFYKILGVVNLCCIDFVLNRGFLIAM